MILGRMNMTDTTFVVDFVRVLKNHFRIGILERIGMPEALSSLSVRSMPPNKIISSFLTRMIDLNLLVQGMLVAVVGSMILPVSSQLSHNLRSGLYSKSLLKGIDKIET